MTKLNVPAGQAGIEHANQSIPRIKNSCSLEAAGPVMVRGPWVKVRISRARDAGPVEIGLILM